MTAKCASRNSAKAEYIGLHCARTLEAGQEMVGGSTALYLASLGGHSEAGDMNGLGGLEGFRGSGDGVEDLESWVFDKIR